MCLKREKLAYVMTLSKQVLKENFAADADEYEAAEGFDFVFEEVAEIFSDEYADVREDKCHEADDYRGRYD